MTQGPANPSHSARPSMRTIRPWPRTKENKGRISQDGTTGPDSLGPKGVSQGGGAPCYCPKRWKSQIAIVCSRWGSIDGAERDRRCCPRPLCATAVGLSSRFVHIADEGASRWCLDERPLTRV